MKKVSLGLLTFAFLSFSSLLFAESSQQTNEPKDVRCMKEKIAESVSINEAYQACSIKK